MDILKITQEGRDWIRLIQSWVQCLASFKTVVDKITVFWLLCPVLNKNTN